MSVQTDLRTVRPPTRWAWIAILLLATGVALASTRYLADGSMVPPPLKLNFDAHTLLFRLHIGAASTALLLGPWQFLGALRRARPRLHRAIGVIYVGACAIGGVAGLLIAPGTNGGPVAALGFASLACLWLWTTGNAVAAIRRHDIPAHRRWMTRSFALTLAGVTLRLYLPVALLAPLAFSTAYAAIAWLCWVPNLIIAWRMTPAPRNA